MKFKTFIDVCYLIGAVFITIGLIRMEITTNENKSAIQQLNLEITRIDLETMELQQQVLELRLEIEKRKRMQE